MERKRKEGGEGRKTRQAYGFSGVEREQRKRKRVNTREEGKKRKEGGREEEEEIRSDVEACLRQRERRQSWPRAQRVSAKTQSSALKSL
eukprot:3842567-Rhodomonas_salina.1